jgi:hypothetical protein
MLVAMASEAELRAALNFGPIIRADATGLTGVHRVAIDGNSQSVAIPSGMRGKWLDVFATVDVQWGFGNGTSAPTIVTNQAAALGAGHASAAKDLPAGTIMPKRIPYDATFIAWKAASAGGFFAFDVSEQPTQ